MASVANGSASTTDNNSGQSTVIIGGGIIGCATAYYLSHSGNTDPKSIHIVEASPELFASASGKAGGFCVADWFGPPTASLGALSFRLHQELADHHDGHRNWGYSRSTASSYTEGSQRRDVKDDWLAEGGSRSQEAGTHVINSIQGVPAWLTRGRGSDSGIIGDEGGVAQVDPLRLSQSLLRMSKERGVELHHPAKPQRIIRDESGNMSHVEILAANGTTEQLPCARLLIAAGAWTPSVFQTLFPTSRIRIGIEPLAGYSLVVKSPRWTEALESKGCHAIFTSMRSGISPEIFSRVGEEIYIAGLNDAELPLPELATDAKFEPSSIDELRRVAEKLLGHEGTKTSDLQILREGLCFRPVTRRGVPVLAQIPDQDLQNGKVQPRADGGVFVAAGHGPWGISHSAGTGKVMAEMIEKQPLSADIRRLGLP